MANRGEIAVRIFRTCRGSGSRPSPLSRRTTRARCTPARPTRRRDRSYLDAAEHVRAAQQAGADAIHPGYGFLAENADFAEAVEAAGLTWVGPPPEALRLGGDKLAAKRIAREAGVPVVPTGEPAEIGFPLVVKAAAGGGGRGMRVVREPGDSRRRSRRPRARRKPRSATARSSASATSSGRATSRSSCSRTRTGPSSRSGERDCSVQRRHQKVIEESPSPGLDPELRARMSDAAVAFAQAIGYASAGTAEFLVDGRDFFFLELNGRIQVEHPVTEAVTGPTSSRAAPGRRGRAARRHSTVVTGHAVEARLYAEDPRSVPPPGRDGRRLRPPAGSASTRASRRATRSGSRYDPMIAKLIAHGADRDEALDAARRTRSTRPRSTASRRTCPFSAGSSRTRRPGRRGLDRVPRRAPAALARRRCGPGAAWRGAWRLNLAPAPPAHRPT